MYRHANTGRTERVYAINNNNNNNCYLHLAGKPYTQGELRSDVTESMVTIRSPFCGYNTI